MILEASGEQLGVGVDTVALRTVVRNEICIVRYHAWCC